MNSEDFVIEERKVLIAQLSECLFQAITHEEIKSYAWSVIDKWKDLNIDVSKPYSEGEKELWCSIWSIQHLASEDHWLDGVAQKELGLLLKVLNNESALPTNYEGCRP